MNVIIGQYDCFQGHVHPIIYANGDSYGYNGGGVPGWFNRGWYKTFNGVPTYNGYESDGTNGKPRTGNETKPTNLTYCLWKRIN